MQTYEALVFTRNRSNICATMEYKTCTVCKRFKKADKFYKDRNQCTKCYSAEDEIEEERKSQMEFNRLVLDRITKLEDKVENIGNLLGDICCVLKEIRSRKIDNDIQTISDMANKIRMK